MSWRILKEVGLLIEHTIIITGKILNLLSAGLPFKQNWFFLVENSTTAHNHQRGKAICALLTAVSLWSTCYHIMYHLPYWYSIFHLSFLLLTPVFCQYLYLVAKFSAQFVDCPHMLWMLVWTANAFDTVHSPHNWEHRGMGILIWHAVYLIYLN